MTEGLEQRTNGALCWNLEPLEILRGSCDCQCDVQLARVFFFALQPLRSVRFKRRSLGQKLGSLDSEMAGRFWSWITPCFGPKV